MQKKIVFLLHLQHLQATVVLKHSLYVGIENRFYYAKNILFKDISFGSSFSASL